MNVSRIIVDAKNIWDICKRGDQCSILHQTSESISRCVWRGKGRKSNRQISCWENGNFYILSGREAKKQMKPYQRMMQSVLREERRKRQEKETKRREQMKSKGSNDTWE